MKAMGAKNSRERIVEICRNQIERFRHAVGLMQAGMMSTGAHRKGQVVNTTQETISEYMVLIADLENTIAMIEAEIA